MSFERGERVWVKEWCGLVMGLRGRFGGNR